MAAATMAAAFGSRSPSRATSPTAPAGSAATEGGAAKSAAEVLHLAQQLDAAKGEAAAAAERALAAEAERRAAQDLAEAAEAAAEAEAAASAALKRELEKRDGDVGELRRQLVEAIQAEAALSAALSEAQAGAERTTWSLLQKEVSVFFQKVLLPLGFVLALDTLAVCGSVCVRFMPLLTAHVQEAQGNSAAPQPLMGANMHCFLAGRSSRAAAAAVCG